MKLIVGLGNPGKEYVKTRHNLGFRVIDSYASRKNIDFKKKFSSLYAQIIINDEKVILLKPQTFMNSSGKAVLQCKKFYDIENEDILVIHDDMDISLGSYKLKSHGSSAGHNGINDIINMLHTDNFKRLRIGISKEYDNKIDYVLGSFSKEDEELLKPVIEKSYDIINDYVRLDFDKLMNKYN